MPTEAPISDDVKQAATRIADKYLGFEISCQALFTDIARAILADREAQAKRVEAESDEAYEIGKRDGYSEAVQTIDVLTGGDGEYRYCTDHDPERHTPDPQTMIKRIVDRFTARALLTKEGSDA